MIYLITQESAHHYGDVMPSMYRLRYHAFIQRQAYNVFHIRKMEYDTYDTPAAVYLVWRDFTGVVRGCARLTPSDRPYMIKDLWPDLFAGSDLPCAATIWEASRFCIDKALSPTQRKQIHAELVYGLQEFGINYSLDHMIGVMQPRIWRQVFINHGWPIDFVGMTKEFGKKEEIVAGRMPLSHEILERLRQNFSLPASIIGNLGENTLTEAA